MGSLLAVAVGGAVGATARHLVTVASQTVGGFFPFATLLVNTIGCFAIGLLAADVLKGVAISDTSRLFLQTGLLGSLTTFSTFSLDSLQLWQAGQIRLAILNVGLNVVLSLAAVVAGFSLVAGRASL